MRTKKFFLWALFLMPLFIACDNDDKNTDGDAVTVDRLVGDWSIKDYPDFPENEKKLTLQKDGKYIGRDLYYWYTEKDDTQIISEEIKTEGTYKVEGNKVITLTGNAYYRECVSINEDGSMVMSEWEPLEEAGEFEPEEINISLKLGGSLMTMSSSNESVVYFFYKDGAKMSSDKSTLKGTWICDYKGKTKTYRYGLKVDGDTFEYVDPYWKEKFVGKFEYKNGYIKTSKTAGYVLKDGETFNMDDVFGNNWELEDDDYGWPAGFPIIIDGNTANVWIDSEFLEFKKK